MSISSTPENARRLLAAINPMRADDTCDWWKIGGALKAISEDLFADFMAWSRTQAHGDERQIENAWRNTTAAASIATLIYYVKMDRGDLKGLKLDSDAPQPVYAVKPKQEYKPKPKLSKEEILNAQLARMRKYICPFDNLSASEIEEILMEKSPVRWDRREPVNDALALIGNLYHPGEYIFSGTAMESGDSEPGERDEWIQVLQARGEVMDPHVICNPVYPEGGMTRGPKGHRSHRCDDAVSAFRYMLIEFDGIDQRSQLAFWLAMVDKDMAIVALIDSGGKSIHGWVYQGYQDAETWRKEIAGLYSRHLEALGADPANKNPARYSRFPGHYREDRGKYQRLIYLNSLIEIEREMHHEDHN